METPASGFAVVPEWRHSLSAQSDPATCMQVLVLRSSVVDPLQSCMMQPKAASPTDESREYVQVKRKSLQGNACPVARTLDLIGDWWSLLIIRDALDGIRRFNDFQKSLDIAKNMLSARLKGLVEQGILQAMPAADGGAYKEYVLTERGKALQTVIVALSQWGGEFMYAPGEPGSVMVDAKDRQPIRKLELIAADGRSLAPEDVATRLGVEH
jgi:DNA-binding HxlR family transcriptional regulator